MKANAPEKIYLQEPTKVRTEKKYDNDVEYIRTDAFIEKALKWYCLDCECNDNCKDTKCFFYREYERYLKGGTNAIPPKFSDRIINEDGSVSEDYRYRHFINRIENAFIEKAFEFFENELCCYVKAQDFVIEHSRLENGFKAYMKGE